jgi:hypothetical protein
MQYDCRNEAMALCQCSKWYQIPIMRIINHSVLPLKTLAVNQKLSALPMGRHDQRIYTSMQIVRMSVNKKIHNRIGSAVATS